jgi:hypothetical protein
MIVNVRLSDLADARHWLLCSETLREESGGNSVKRRMCRKHGLSAQKLSLCFTCSVEYGIKKIIINRWFDFGPPWGDVVTK